MFRDVDEGAIAPAVIDSYQDHWCYVDQPFEGEYRDWMHFIEYDVVFDPSLWFLALDEKIARFSLCRLKISDSPEMSWVGALRLYTQAGMRSDPNF